METVVDVWIAILSTFAFIRKDKFKDTFKISKMFLNDKYDLIHNKNMPRTMLRYAIERFPEKKRKEYLNG
ncbi:DNA alkylation repair protein [Candidatus Wolfebacteria bacterium]|nr:DNA alkylation repair protein [Candidatus Wolfebacteria bacterium]NCO44554.1 DNA alkylation repair protein [Candidatus Wolfebacteria bacterium]